MKLAELRALARSFAELPADVREVYARVRELQAEPWPTPPPPPPPSAFVAVLVQGHGPRGPTTLGTARELTARAGHVLELQTQMPLWDVRLIVFADLRRVTVAGIFRGVDLLSSSSSLGSCPVAYCERWDVGVWLRIQCSLNEKE